MEAHWIEIISYNLKEVEVATKVQLMIEGNLVTKRAIESGTDYYGGAWEKVSQGKTVELDAWLEQVLKQRGEQVFIPQLADGHIVTRKSQGVREVAVVEFQPAVRRIIEKVDDHYEEHARLVAFPWVYLVVRFKNGLVDTMYVFYRNQRAEGLDAEMYLPNLPNVYSQGDGYKICTGTISGLQSEWALARKLDWLVRNFFDSQFNKDLIDYHWNPSRRIEGHPRSFSDWEQRSKDDPRFILKINWRPLGKSLQQILDEGVADGRY